MSTHAISRAAIAVTITFIGACAESSPGARDAFVARPAEGSNSLLQLDEVSTRVIPDSFTLAGVDGTAERTLLWATNQSFVIMDDHGQERIIRRRGMGPPIAAALVGDSSVLEVLDVGSVVRLSKTGNLLQRWNYKVSFSPSKGVRSEQTWYVGGLNRRGDFEIVVMKASGETAHYYTLPRARLSPRKEDSSFFNPVHLTPVGRYLMVTVVNAPYENILLDAEGTEQQTFTPPAHTDSTPPGTQGDSMLGQWISLPTLPLDCGFLQTISDLRSDRRRLVLYDDGGNLLRESLIVVPLGFVDVVGEDQRLIAARSTTITELVGYRWKWTAQRQNMGGTKCVRR
jgi:hypothetical protein